MIVGVSIASLFCSVFTGMFGMAGGILLLAILFSVDFPHEVAIPLHGVLMLISHSLLISAYYRHISKSALLMFVIGSIPSLFVVFFLIGNIDRHFAQLVISIIIIYLTWAPKKIRINNPVKSTSINMIFAGMIGGVTSLVIGAAGTFIAPLYLREEWDNKTIMGTKSACMGYLQIFKISTYSYLGFKILDHLKMLAPMSICVIVGILIGIYFVGKLSTRMYRFLYKSVLTFAVVLLIADVVIDHYGGFKEFL